MCVCVCVRACVCLFVCMMEKEGGSMCMRLYVSLSCYACVKFETIA